MTITSADFRSCLGCFATGVTVITLDQDGEVHGMTANAFTSVSLDPPLVLVCINRLSRTYAYLQNKNRFGVNILAEDQKAISEYYALPANTREKTQRVAVRFLPTKNGTPMLEGALAQLECRTHDTQISGDHTIFIAEIEEVQVRKGKPLLYFCGDYRSIGIAPALSNSE
ncbi:MAG TPA: flavin reductase family protein [Terriglobales bacterium]|nr:flavin reductase family protein [Terriglobales bacterium]